jgi:hypothetical protein
MPRILEPEWLDALPHDHPDALHNRRDLRITNRVLGTHRWIARTLPPLLRNGERALELGAGTGELGGRLAAAGACVDGLDLWPRPPSWRTEQRWHIADLRQFGGYADYEAVFGNLILHQFTDDELAALGTQLRKATRVIVACEPARRKLSQVLYRFFGTLLGANHVSLHDAHVSVAAGFRGDELPRTLGLSADEWDVRCTTTLLGLYRLVAVRRS